MSIKFSCRECDTALVVLDELAGRLMQCPTCHEEIDIPGDLVPRINRRKPEAPPDSWSILSDPYKVFRAIGAITSRFLDALAGLCRALIWIGVLIFVPVTCSNYSSLLSSHEKVSAIQQAAAAADACVYIIAVYVFARAVEGLRVAMKK